MFPNGKIMFGTRHMVREGSGMEILVPDGSLKEDCPYLTVGNIHFHYELARYMRLDEDVSGGEIPLELIKAKSASIIQWMGDAGEVS